VGKEGNRVVDVVKIPYTLESFKRYCRLKHGEVQHYFDNMDNYYDEFCVICSRIREEIRENQIIGGMAGFFNPSITNRLNGLTETTKTELTGNLPTTVTFNFTDMSEDKTEENELL